MTAADVDPPRPSWLAWMLPETSTVTPGIYGYDDDPEAAP